ncbi:MAG: hypothetical protein DI565_12790 [Ancylobacter novellus]|uniref:Uncharacterized protein n=1 Tax=Ancylobacter novellus TaxID=921 RepID=A0A2W5KBQ8_ANCNO|nr:MAG: hypothetical protein DI565_12790 [Ancylobacter novellus]
MITLSEKQSADLRRMWSAGAGRLEVRAAFGLSEKVLSRLQKELGLEARGSGPGRPFTSEEASKAEDMLAAGQTVAEVARALGRDRTSVDSRFVKRRALAVARAEEAAEVAAGLVEDTDRDLSPEEKAEEAAERATKAARRRNRPCILCREAFMSDHAGHRVCSPCRATDEWRAA